MVAFTGLNFWELALILLIALLIFGPKKLPEMGKSLGAGLREFKKASSGVTDSEKETDADKPK